jgi:hypothetical protein
METCPYREVDNMKSIDRDIEEYHPGHCRDCDNGFDDPGFDSDEVAYFEEILQKYPGVW